MIKKDTVVFALYVTTAVATIAHASTEMYKTFKRDKPLRQQIKTAKTEN